MFYMLPLESQYSYLKDVTYHGSPLAKAETTSEEIACAIKQLKTWVSDIFSGQSCIIEKSDIRNVKERGYYVAFDRYLEKQGTYKKLETDNPLGKLVHKLAQQVLQEGIPITFAGVRFEQGFVRGHADWWHVDEIETVVSIGFSNKAEWNTKIISDHNIESLPAEVFKNLYSNTEELDKLAETTKHGHFYYGARVFHRSPKESDMADPISENDYRLFIRFL